MVLLETLWALICDGGEDVVFLLSAISRQLSAYLSFNVYQNTEGT